MSFLDTLSDGFEWVKETGGDFVDGISDAYSHTHAHLEAHFSNKGDDLLIGNGSDNYLYGGAGNDTIQGMGGRDVMQGGIGRDTLDVTEWHGRYTLNMETGVTNWAGETATGFERVLLGNGHNTVWGTNFDDEVHLGGGNDRAFGRDGDDTLFGQDGNDSLGGEAGNDLLDGGNGKDTLEGGDHADVLIGGRGNDLLLGGDGNDIIQGGAGRDKMNGGDGIDTLVVVEWNGSFDIDLGSGYTNWSGETAINFENVVLGNGKNKVTGSSDDNKLFTRGGNDRVFARDGDDYVSAGSGRDVVDGGRGEDTLIGGEGNDVLTGGKDADTFVFGAQKDGFDRITDFEKGVDVLDFSNTGADDMADLRIWGRGDDTLIDFGSGKLRLEGIDITEVDTTLFDFG